VLALSEAKPEETPRGEISLSRFCNLVDALDVIYHAARVEKFARGFHEALPNDAFHGRDFRSIRDASRATHRVLQDWQGHAARCSFSALVSPASVLETYSYLRAVDLESRSERIGTSPAT